MYRLFYVLAGVNVLLLDVSNNFREALTQRGYIVLLDRCEQVTCVGDS